MLTTPPAHETPFQETPFQEAVLAWSATSGAWRDLPWRRTRDPWAVLVSEVMLQQTQVARVIPRWHSFLARFPDPAACAAAPVGEVIGLWVGLGYNRRAVQLHRAAAAVVDRHEGRLPATLAELRALPGVGAYTARAVLAFAFEQPAGVVDTNVARVLARAVAGRRLTAAEVQAAADAQVPAGRSWSWNQALLDLGARHCTGVHPCVPRMSLGAGPLSLGRSPFFPARSRGGIGGCLGAPVALRRLRPPGAGSPGGGPATGPHPGRAVGRRRRLAR